MLYSNYTERLKNIVSESKTRKELKKGFSNFSGPESRSHKKKDLFLEQKDFGNKIQLKAEPLNTILDLRPGTNAELGHHPDFKHLKNTNQTELHYIVSVFIDIHGSTNLHKEYELDEIFAITNTIQTAAIQTCLAMGGHVQRLEGDGIFAYFGGKSVDKNKAVEMALTACSMFTYFVKNDLKDVFYQEGIEDINTRIGIDFGDDKDVLWANFGFLNISELTTLSLHTSLAKKMQAYAESNGVVVGQNIKDRLQTYEDIFDLVRNEKGEITKRYIFENPSAGFRYTQYRFEWYRFLKSLPFVVSDANGKLSIVTTEMKEQERLARLRNTATLVSSGNAYTNTSGFITADENGVKNQEHRFHYGK